MRVEVRGGDTVVGMIGALVRVMHGGGCTESDAGRSTQGWSRTHRDFEGVMRDGARGLQAKSVEMLWNALKCFQSVAHL
jgi:hypothetical protein